jgi:short-subunit dehydrogenase
MYSLNAKRTIILKGESEYGEISTFVAMQNKVAIVTGGTSGIGKAIAQEFAYHDFTVIITGRKKKTLEEVATGFAEAGAKVYPIVADVSQEADNQKMISEVMDQFGRIDCLINNAGISMRALFKDLDLAVFKKVMNINFMGSVYATRYALPHIIRQKGSVIAISSINGHRGTPARTAYTASKYAMNGFFEALRTELLKTGVHILVVSPGFTSSNIRNRALTGSGQEQGESPRDESKMMSAETVAAKVYQAYVKKKRDLILTRQGKLAVWLNKLMPGMMDKMVYNLFQKEEGSPLNQVKS